MASNDNSPKDTTAGLRLQRSDIPQLSPESALRMADRAAAAQMAATARAEEQKLNRRNGLLVDSHVPPRLIKSLGSVSKRSSWGERLDNLAGKLGSGFLYGLIGINGTGKSQMGVALIVAAIEKDITARFIHAPELMDSIKDVYRADDGSTVQEQLKQYFSPKLLVIDEVNQSAMTEADVRYLHRIICRRYDDMTDTLLISNDTKPVFQKLIGDRVVSRMIETGGIIECTWPSFRR